MQIRIRETGAVMYESELRQWAKDNNGPSWGQTTEEVLEALGADPVLEGPQATCGRYQFSMRQGVEQIDGKWYTKYVAGPIFVDGETTAAEQEAAYRAMKDTEQARAVRNDRNTKLAECDWTQLTDSTAAKAAWATYRQALLDITTQAGFPWTVEWPVAP